MARLHRRTFLGGGAALVIAFHFSIRKASASAEAGAKKKRTAKPNAFLRVSEDDVVTVLVPKAEMGQGVMTSLPMILCEELGADFSRIRVEYAPAGTEYVMPMSFGMQITGGATSAGGLRDRPRQARAPARALVEGATPKAWRGDGDGGRGASGRAWGREKV